MSASAATHCRGDHTSNVQVAEQLERVADLLEAQGASPFRVEAYRRGANTVRDLPTSLTTLVAEDGRTGLESLPGIGRALAGAILELVETGGLRLLDRLLGAASPERLFTSLPGVGAELAKRIHEQLGVETLEELETAAWDGRLEKVPGFGPRRAEVLRSVLETRLSFSRRRRAHERLGAAPRTESDRPSVEDLLSVDEEYRTKAEAGTLPVITPRRFNPRGTAWLPVLHTERCERAFHAFFSNTPLAHRLGRTRDWVVIYWDRDGEEGQATIVTERRGDLSTLRVVRGREEECRRYYRQSA